MSAPLTFAAEPLTRKLLAEALPLLQAHWREVAHYADIPLDVDVDTYLAAEVAGNVRCFTARGVPNRLRPIDFTGPNALLGYAVFFARRNLHYKSSLQAVQDVLYLHPSARGGTGAKFIAWCDEQLREEGVQVVFQHQKMAHPQLGNALAALGYEPVERMWSKRLDTPTTWNDVVQRANVTTADLNVSVADLARRAVTERRVVTPWNADDATNDANRTHLEEFSETMQQLAGAHE